MPQVVAKLNNDDISLQIVDELCSVPLGYHRYIIDKCKENPGKAITNFNKSKNRKIECIAIVRTYWYNESDKRKHLDFGKEHYFMAVKSANLYVRIEPDVKEQAESILSALGIPASNAINMFYKQIILNRGLPFEVKIPASKPANAAELNEADLNAELEKGYADMRAGRTKPAREAFADIRKEYGL